MSWAKLCGSFCFHRKVLEADLLTKHRASGAIARMISWSAENMTGGELSAAMALTIAKDQRVLNALVTVGMLERDGDDYLLHDFADYNPSGEELSARREQLRASRSEAGRRGAAARWGRSPSGDPVPSGRRANDGHRDGKPDGNLPFAEKANGADCHGKNMTTSPSPSPPPLVVDFALTRVDLAVDAEDGRKPKARMAKHTPEQIAAKDRVIQTFMGCFRAKKQVEPKAILAADHAKAFELAKRFGPDEACSIVRRAFEHDFVVRENSTLRYIASHADTFRGTVPQKTHGRHEQQQVVGDEPWLREHLS
jgi:hypothetical protein